MVELATHLGVQRGGRTNGSSRAALAGAFAALIACTLLAVTHRNSAMPTALTGWLATGHAGPIPFQVPPAEAAAQGVTSGEVSLPFHSSGANYGGLAPLLSLWPSSISLSHLQHPHHVSTVVTVHVISVSLFLFLTCAKQRRTRLGRVSAKVSHSTNEHDNANSKLKSRLLFPPLPFRATLLFPFVPPSCSSLCTGTGTAAHPLDGKGWNDEIPKYLMEPKW